ncbi:DUF2125 domain-containing protein [Parvibaculum sp.]|uniref:DUF2125 domain-containing protein n=1 Tax=Parvibaculum sp. TaxID=2024848 RepID=UPI0032995B92
MSEAATEGKRTGIRWGIIGPSLAFAIFAAAYSVYWFTIAGEVRKAVEIYAARSEKEVVTSWDGFAVGGYPFRIEAQFTAPKAAAPATPEKWEWQGEGAYLALQPHNLRHMVLTLEGEQRLSYRDLRTAARATNEARFTAGSAQASYVLLEDKPFGRLAIDMEALKGEHHLGANDTTEELTAKRLQLHARPAESPEGIKEPGSYDIALQAEDVDVDSTTKIPALGPRMEFFLAQTRLRGLPPGNYVSLVELMRDWQAAGGTLAISDLAVKWGPLDLYASGELGLDAKHRPEGQLDARITDFEGLLDAMVEDGIVQEREARIAMAGLVLVSQFQGSKSNEIRMPVIMREGKLYLGPLVIAKLEPLY